MKVSGIEVVVQFCVDPEKSKVWYADFLGLETTEYPSPLFVLGGSTLLLAPGVPGTGRGGTGGLADDRGERVLCGTRHSM